jgi:hypothetical protein
MARAATTGFDGRAFADIGLTRARLEGLLGEHERLRRSRYAKWWAYYRNPSADETREGRTRLAQERGLPWRLRDRGEGSTAREVVIENDIAWRVDAMIDFMFGQPIRLLSLAGSAERRREIERALEDALERSGGVALFQNMALLGAVFGHVDLRVRDSAQGATLEAISPERGVAALDPNDYTRLLGYVIVSERAEDAAPLSIPQRALRAIGLYGATEAGAGVLEVLSASRRQVYDNGRLVVDEANALGALPVVHIQNRSQPLRYGGIGEVEALIPLQDELNTRLSDRAHRVTMQSFKMYLAKGMDGFGAGGPASIGPGQVWSTENLDASVEAFGGDASSPSEDAHIEQIRQALDKASGVTPVAAGVIRERVGQLSSANALRITLMGLLSKTARKQVTYGRGLRDAARLLLALMDATGEFRTSEEEREVRVEWPEILPSDARERLEAAQMKRDLGVPVERVLAELGYAPGDPGVT